MAQQTKQEISFEISLNTDNQPAQRSTFGEMFSKAVDSAFSMLGIQAKQALFCHLEIKLGLPKDQFGCDVLAFGRALEEIFGPAGRLIEMQIMRELHTRTSLFEHMVTEGELCFVDYIEALRSFV